MLATGLDSSIAWPAFAAAARGIRDLIAPGSLPAMTRSHGSPC